ncbi:MAG: TetR/AcrR family transcriptional regulator [Pseudobacteriovorax sp.]|nr:TetR/AcrR family transcriptional regulator [Pseudobacteriovorax sp.]
MPTEKIENLDTARVAKIMSAAITEFSQNDFDKASFNKIIKASGISKGTMYYYFKSKQDLFLTLLNACKKEFKELPKANSLAGESVEEFWTQCNTILTQIFATLNARPSLKAFIYEVLNYRDSKDQNPAAEMLQSLEDQISDFVIRGQLCGAIRRDWPLELIIAILWSHWKTTTDWYDVAGKETSTDAAEFAVELARSTLERLDQTD